MSRSQDFVQKEKFEQFDKKGKVVLHLCRPNIRAVIKYLVHVTVPSLNGADPTEQYLAYSQQAGNRVPTLHVTMDAPAEFPMTATEVVKAVEHAIVLLGAVHVGIELITPKQQL